MFGDLKGLFVSEAVKLLWRVFLLWLLGLSTPSGASTTGERKPVRFRVT